MKIGFIGTGNMSKALIIGCVGIFSKNDIYITNRTQEKAEKVAEETGVNLCTSNQEVVDKCDIIILGVKPNMYEEVLTELNVNDKVMVSIAAGLSLKYLYSLVDNSCVFVRTMPNTPSQVLTGMTGITFDSKIKDEYKNVILEFFGSVGEVVEVGEEHMDLVVGLSGSSPAYGYMFIHAMALAGEKMGMDYELALKLSANSILGASKMILETGINPTTLRDNVCSKGGTTIEGVEVLKDDIDGIMFDTVKAVVDKSKLLTK